MSFKQLILLASISAMIVLFVACVNRQNNNTNSLPATVSYNFHIRPILSDKCFKCHGPDQNKREAGLRLDVAESAYGPLQETKGAFAIVPGKPDSSELIRRISSQDPSYMMPTPDSHLGTLSPKEIELFRKWIENGAVYEPLWSFTPPQKSPVPALSDKNWARNEIDNFIGEKLSENGLSHAEEADKERLLKRISIDLTGLPPSEERMNRFLQDKAPNAYEKMVEELLNLPQYGEKMALHWLDVGRYADSYGYQDDNIRTQWAWRDWVIHAFNKNIPYNEFLTWQIAGDLIPGASKEQVLATAFFRNHKYTEEGGVIPEEYRIQYNLDKTKTYSKGILGLTMECAQCHDHKYDPISQKSYYEMFAFFNNSREQGYEGDVSISKPAKTPILTITSEEIKKIMPYLNVKDTNQLSVSVMGDQDTVRPTYILNRGVYDQPTTLVRPTALENVMPFDSVQYPRNRLGLAKWTVSEKNPLTARVFVNQVWQEIFGRGLVKTSGDFGMQGDLPSHPKLLDWLAVDFMENGWDIKKLVKKIVTSATYRQSAVVSKEALENDPENIYLSHAPRVRLKAELVRDLVLSSSGLLVSEIGGPSVKPYQPKGLWESATSGRGVLATYKQDTGSALYRRGMYTFIKLTVPPPSMGIFDASNRDQCEVKRLQTNTPLQALAMMNDPYVLEASRVFSQRLLAADKNMSANIQKAFHRIVCRTPGKKETEMLEKYYADQLAAFKSGKLDAGKTIKVGEYPQDASLDKNELAALMKLVNLVYNMEETIVKS